MGYSENVIKGFSWQTMLRYSSIALVIGKSLIIAKILSPSELGLFAIVAIALGVSEAATETGVNTIIVQSKQSVKYFLNSAWVIAIVRGFLIGLVMILLGFVLQNLFQEPDLLFLITAVSFAPIIKGFINPAIVSLHKHLLFFQDAAYRFSLTLVEAVSAVILTIWLQSVMGLVLSILVTALFEVIISFIFFDQRPKFAYLPERGKLILTRAKSFSFMTVTSYLFENLDDFVIGKLTGTYQLGLYHWGYKLGHMPNNDLGKALLHSTLPVFSKIHTNRRRLKEAYTKSLTWLLVLVVVASIPVLLFAKPMIGFLLNEEWLGITPILPWLLGAGIIQAGINLTYSLFLSVEKRTYINTHQLLTVLLMVPSIILGVQVFGFVGAGIGILASRILTLPILVQQVKKVL